MVLIAIPHTGNLRYSLVEKLLDYDKKDDVEIYMSQHRPVDVNRCEIADYFMNETDHDRLVMIDSDIVPPEDLLEMLDEYSDEPVLSPVVFSTDEGIPYPVATIFSDQNDQLRMYSGEMDELIEADAIGTGCIALKREVFEALDKPYFEFDKDEDGTMNTGEDFDFTIRATEKGFPPKMATDYVAGHITEIDVKRFMEIMKLALDANPSDIYVEEVG